MSSENTFKNEVTKLLRDSQTRPLDAYEKVKRLLIDAGKEGGRFNPLKPLDNWKPWRDGFHVAHKWFIDENRKWFFASEKLLIDWWNLLGQIQFEKKRRIYRAECAYLLTDLYELMGQRGLALRWAMLMQADDILGEHPEGGGAGRQILTTKYGLGIAAFDEFNQIASECLVEVKNNADWSQPAGFAEEVICRFAQKKAGYTLADTASSREFPVSPAYLQSLLNLVRSNENTTDKGKSLEYLALYLMLLLPGCVPHKNVLAEQKIFETDVLVNNLSPTPTVVTELLGRQFLIECKNRKEKMSVSEIGYFLYRMKLTHIKFGIVFSPQGISGIDKKEAGFELIRRAYQEDDLICVVMRDSDLNDLVKGNQLYFWWMLLGKIEELRFGKPKVGNDSKDIEVS